MEDKIKFRVMWRKEVVADVEASYKDSAVKVKNYTDNWIKRPFGNIENPTINDFDEFLESRCFPKDRVNCDQLLEDLGLKVYDPLSIVEITHGRQFEDYMWIKFDGEDLDYDRDIRLRD